MVSYGGNSVLVRQKRGLRSQVHISRNEVEEAMELVACGFKADQCNNRPKVVMQQRQTQLEDDDLALAIALSQSMVTTTPTHVLQGTIANLGSVGGIEDNIDDSDNASCSEEASIRPPSCANDFAIAMALNALDGASSCVADLESIQLEDEDTSCTQYDAGMILVGDDADEDDDWSCVIHGDLQEILGPAAEGGEAEATWSVVSSDQEYIIPQEHQKPTFISSYKEVLECCLMDRKKMGSGSQPTLHRPNTQASKTFVRPLHDDGKHPDSSLRPIGNDSFTDWDHFKIGNLGTKGSSPWWKTMGGWDRAEQLIRSRK